MKTPTPTEPLLLLLADISGIIPELSSEELHALASQWQQLAAEPPQHLDELLRQLTQMISSSPTLLRHHFDKRLPQPARYSLNTKVPPAAAPPPVLVRNEVVYQIRQLNTTIQHQAAS